MQEWYYSADGQQRGPVSLAELQERARTGKLDAAKDLVWNAGMTEWLPAGRVPEIFSATPSSFGSSNPYAPPGASTLLASPPDGVLHEIEPGSQPLDGVECLKRAFTLMNRNLKPMLVITLVYFGVSIVIQLVLGLLGGRSPISLEAASEFSWLAFLVGIISNIVSLFLYLGYTRVALNVASGNDLDVAQLFGGGAKLLRAVGASILFYIMFMVGLMLLIVPGIYIGLRFSHFMTAIVDKDLGVIDSLKYSLQLTKNSVLPSLLLWILLILVMVAGALALMVGLVYATPVVILAQMAAYRWLQYGPVALTDEPGTQTPVLRGRTQGSIIG